MAKKTKASKKLKASDVTKKTKKSLSHGQHTIGGYDAINHDGSRRKSPPRMTASEDWHLNSTQRIAMSGNARDLARNSSLVMNALRNHVAFVADLSFHAKTTDRGFNKELEQWWCERCRAENFDVAGRHSWQRGMRLTVACGLLDGDTGWLKLGGGSQRGKVQMIEGDRIGTPTMSLPTGFTPEEWVNGVRVDTSTGKALQYAICKRMGGSAKVLDRVIPARNMLLHAHYSNRIDQVRGVSLIASAMNAFRDCAETIDFAYAKVKLSQLAGMITTRADDGTGTIAGPGGIEFTQDADGDGTNDTAPRIDPKMVNGLFGLELEPGEDFKIVESATPSTETMDFVRFTIQLALSSLGIPYCMYDEAYATYAGQKASINRYLYVIKDYISDLQWLAMQHCRWAMGLAIIDGELKLPSGKDFDFVDDAFEFVPGAFPWSDQPQRDTRNNAMLVAMGISDPYRISQELGYGNPENTIDKIAQFKAYCKEADVDVTYTDSTLFAPELMIGGNEDQPTSQK